MYLEDLANELLLHIFDFCSSIQDVLSLASANRRFHKVFSGSRKLSILFHAAEIQYGPLEDAIQLVTQNASQPSHHIRTAPLSLALLKQLITVGICAKKWEEVYPTKKWKHDFEDRRLLTSNEAFRLRRAIYRSWLYTRAFHNARYPRTSRMMRHNILERAELLHNWSPMELAEIEDIRAIVTDVLQSHVCPSNGTIQRKFRKRNPDSEHQLLFNIHLNYPPPANAFQTHFVSAHQVTASPKASAGLKYTATAWHEPGGEGWGDETSNYYVVQDMLKLDPGQILWLRENAPFKGMVEAYVRNLGDWFEDNGETFGQTMEHVMAERGEDMTELKDAIQDRVLGIVRG